MSKELSPLVIYQIFKGKYLAKYEFSIGEPLTYDEKCISLYSLLGYILGQKRNAGYIKCAT